jgi:hypothetical protein
MKILLAGTGLATTVLAQIWALAARPGSKTLGEEEFMVCNLLVTAAVRGVPLPSSVPKELLKSLRKPSKDQATVATPPSASPPPAASSPPVSRIKTSRPASKGESPERRKSGTLKSSAGAEAPGSGKKKSKWAMSKDQKRRFIETFGVWNQEGFVNGETAVRLFTQSGLPQQDLASIWALSDMDRDTKLSQQEFCIAMFLIARRMQGEALPPSVPTATVLSSSSSDLMSGGKKSKGLSRAGASSGLTRTAAAGAPPQRSVSMANTQSSSQQQQQQQQQQHPSHRSSMMIPPSAINSIGDGAMGGFEVSSGRSGLQRSNSSADNSLLRNNTGLDQDHSFGSNTSSASRQPLAHRSVTSVPYSSGGFGGGGGASYSASELPTDSIGGGGYGGYGSQSFGSMRSAHANMPSISNYGVDDKIIPEYDSSSDLMKLEEITDLPTVRMLMMQLTEEVNTLGATYDRAQLQHETLKAKLTSSVDSTSMTLRRRTNFENILRNYNQQLEADMGLYDNLKSELNEISFEIDSQHQLLNSPQYDLTALRERRRALHSEYARVKAEANASHDEHTRLVLEVEKLRAAGAEQASQINTDWSDHGFKEEPVVAFGDSDFASTASTSSLPITSSTFSPTFNFNPKAPSFGSTSGTMTPSIDDFDFNDGASEVGEEMDLGWLNSEFSSPSTSTAAPGANADFFAAESTNWANFSVQEDERRRERAASISKDKKPASRKIKIEPKSPSNLEDEKKDKKDKKKKKHH